MNVRKPVFDTESSKFDGVNELSSLIPYIGDKIIIEDMKGGEIKCGLIRVGHDTIGIRLEDGNECSIDFVGVGRDIYYVKQISLQRSGGILYVHKEPSIDILGCRIDVLSILNTEGDERARNEFYTGLR